MSKTDKRLDEAARAGWLYYVAGNTQDEIAVKLGVSRQSAQRLVAHAMSAGLVKVRIDHPLANCLDLASKMRKQFGLKFCEVAPTDSTATSTTLGVSDVAAGEIERWLRFDEPKTLAIGTGRTLKAAIDRLPQIDCPQHVIVSLTGNISPDGAAAYFNVVFNIANLVTARCFPMPLPVITTSARERSMLHAQKMIRSTLDRAARADVAFVGVGDLSDNPPLLVDGFISHEELVAMQTAGAVGEIVGWAYDCEGCLIDGQTNSRVTSAPLPAVDSAMVIAVAKGRIKLPAIRAAIKGRLINGLITDEQTADSLLSLQNTR